MVLCNNILLLAKYWFANQKVDYVLSEEDIRQIYDPDFYCGCACCHLTTQTQLFFLRPMKLVTSNKVTVMKRT